MKICIMGGGAAGLMAAAAAVETDPSVEVILIEKNDSLGKKVIISGGGRCNVTTGLQDVRTVLTKYPRGGKFLNSAMHRFSPSDVYRWFESHGVPLKTEDDMRVFPRSNDGRDVIRMFEKLFTEAGVKIMFNSQATGIARTDDGYKLAIKGKNSPLLADKVIITTGGQAYRQTGSTGDGYALASSLGHHITELASSLSALFTQETWPAEVAGLSFDNIGLSVIPADAGIQNPKKSDGFPTSSPKLLGDDREGIVREGRDTTSRTRGTLRTMGPILFTHKGITGPAVFAFSSLVAFEKFDDKRPLAIALDLFPDRTANDLAEAIKTKIADNPKKSCNNVLSMAVPKSLAGIVNHELTLDGKKRANEMSKKDIMSCVAWFKSVPLHVIARSAGEEFVTAGGVDLKEIDPSTMESKICPGLYFAGEILDIDGFTGGFNLQSAWATGHLAGDSAAS